METIKTNTIVKKIILYFVGNFSSKVVMVLLIPIYAFFITPSDLGSFDYAQTIMNILAPIIFLDIWDAILKFSISKKEINHRNVFTTLLLYVFTTLILALGFTFSLYNLGHFNVNYFGLIVFMIVTYALAQIWQYSARAVQNSIIYVISGIVGSIICLLLVLIFVVWMKMGLIGLYLSYTISQLCIVLIIEIKIQLCGYFSIKYFDFGLLREMLKFSAPMMLNIISLWLISGLSKVIVTNFLGTSANGLYSFANKFAVLVTTFGSIIAMALIEEAYDTDDLNKYTKKFTYIIQQLFKFYFSVVIVAIPLIQIIFELFLVNTDYYTSVYLIPLFLLYAVFTNVATNFGSAFQVTDKTNYIFTTTILGAVVSVSGSLILLNYIGLYGIIFGQLTGGLVMMLARAFFAYKLTGLNIKWIPIIIPSVYVITLSLIRNQIIMFILLIANCIFVMLRNKNEIMNIIKMIQKKCSRRIAC
ncbi:oligosaccharide flippase family protein [Desulfosporosinus shakirovi]|uniref:oligosaccharide flippase family protein n=1 Tax=Desulfosporosinus shakirovi TaxID=2885154 RepID=UPI001E3251F2|nr:oligosaccharide flippase family protein [Desulfosporosinus sp. SRJS8]MCB8817597.1 oligosaccharide flippase family protein [Desulfosporosinus sp. SRJS8]